MQPKFSKGIKNQQEQNIRDKSRNQHLNLLGISTKQEKKKFLKPKNQHQAIGKVSIGNLITQANCLHWNKIVHLYRLLIANPNPN